MLVARSGELLTRAGTNIAQRIGIFRTAFKQLSREGRDPRAIPCSRDRCSDHIDIALGEAGGY